MAFFCRIGSLLMLLSKLRWYHFYFLRFWTQLVHHADSPVGGATYFPHWTDVSWPAGDPDVDMTSNSVISPARREWRIFVHIIFFVITSCEVNYRHVVSEIFHLPAGEYLIWSAHKQKQKHVSRGISVTSSENRRRHWVRFISLSRSHGFWIRQV